MPCRFAKVQGPHVSQFAHSSQVSKPTLDSFSSLPCDYFSISLDAGTMHYAAEAPKAAVARGVLFGETLSPASLQQWWQQVNSPANAQLHRLQPHAELPAAIEVRLDAPLPTDIAQAWYDAALTLGLELVYQQQEVLLDVPGVLVMDMDSTAIQIECIDEIATLAGTGEQVAAVTARAMQGELDFAQSLRERVATLAGAPAQILADVLARLPLMPGLTPLCQTLLAKQWQVVIASGGFTYFTHALQKQLGLSATYANELEIIDGKLTGQVLGAIVDAQTKADVVQRTALANNIPMQQTVAIGDGANDLPMLACAALGVAFHAKPKVQAQAKAAIRHGSLLQLLYLLGHWKA